jgi:hypothetical protein
VAATATGQIVAAVGDPNWLCFLRSAAKPFQAIAVLRTIRHSTALRLAVLPVSPLRHYTTTVLANMPVC